MLISKLCRASGLSKDTIRHYEALGLLHSTPRRAGSRIYRDYGDDSFERLELIALAKRLKFSLREIGPGLDDLLNDRIDADERSARLRKKLVELDAEIAAMQQARDELARFVDAPHKDHADRRLQELGLSLSDKHKP